MNLYKMRRNAIVTAAFAMLAANAPAASSPAPLQQIAQAQDSQGDASGASGAAKGQSQAGATKLPSGHPAVIYMAMPQGAAGSDSATKQGCWARVYEMEDFKGEGLTLIGPAAIADLSGPFGLNWDDRINSMETGPQGDGYRVRQ